MHRILSKPSRPACYCLLLNLQVFLPRPHETRAKPYKDSGTSGLIWNTGLLNSASPSPTHIFHKSLSAAVPNRFGTSNQFRGKTIFPQSWETGDGFVMIQASIYCALYFYLLHQLYLRSPTIESRRLGTVFIEQAVATHVTQRLVRFCGWFLYSISWPRSLIQDLYEGPVNQVYHSPIFHDKEKNYSKRTPSNFIKVKYNSQQTCWWVIRRKALLTSLQEHKGAPAKPMTLVLSLWRIRSWRQSLHQHLSVLRIFKGHVAASRGLGSWHPCRELKQADCRHPVVAQRTVTVRTLQTGWETVSDESRHLERSCQRKNALRWCFWLYLTPPPGVDLKIMIYKSLKLFNNSPFALSQNKTKTKNSWLTLKGKFIHLLPHMDTRRKCTHTQTVHLHHSLPPLTLPHLLDHVVFSFPAMAAGEVNSFLKDHLISLIVPSLWDTGFYAR